MSSQAAARLLERIAQELSSPDVVFPTSFELTLRVQTLLKDPDVSIEKLSELIKTEPLMSTKLLAYANSAAIRGAGAEITDIGTAVMRIGFDAVRTVSYTLAVEQITRTKHMLPFQSLSNDIWQHSLAVAALARLLARRQRMNAEKAFFMGMIHDIGAFYLLFRCASDPELASQPEALVALVFEWHDGIGHALLSAMSQPEDILTAIQDHEAPINITTLSNWTTILACADRLGERLLDWVPAELRAGHKRDIDPALLDEAAQQELLDQAQVDLASLRTALL